MKTIKIINSLFAENTYLVIDEENSGYIIDPGNEFKNIKSKIEDTVKIKGILLTHGHFDHFISAEQLASVYDCPIYLHPADLCLANGEQILDPAFSSVKYQIKNEIKDCFFDLSDKNIEVISTPGHSKGSVCYYFKNENILFTGDTLFKGDVGRIDLYGGSARELQNSIKNLFKLPDQVIIYPGHGSNSTIGVEKHHNFTEF